MVEWMQKALEKLSTDEFARVMNKVENLYKQSGKIINISRNEQRVQVTIQLSSGENKLVVL